MFDTTALICVTLIAIASIAALVYTLHCQLEERAQVVLERRELLERIQRPELIPVATPAEPGDVSYVDEQREWELSPRNGPTAYGTQPED